MHTAEGSFDDNGKRTTVFQLEDDPSNPHFLDTLPPFWNAPRYAQEWRNQCGFASARRGTPAVDVFCRNMAFGVQWRPESGELAATDHVAPWQPDRFNNPVPEFGHTQNFVASPDGRHAYLSTEDEGLLVFERIGVGAAVMIPPLGIPGEMFAPANEAAFNNLFVGKRAAADDPTAYVDFVAAGRFKETVGAETYTGSYSYSNTGVNTGDVVLNYDDGDRCTIHVVFTSTTAGTANSTCTDGESLQPNWRLTQIPAGGRAPLFEAIRGLLQL